VRFLILILGIALAVVIGLTVLQRQNGNAPLEMLKPREGSVAPPTHAFQKLWPLPPFSLTERSGKPVSLSDLKGKVWVADFFYASCPGPCPMVSSRLSALQKAIGDDPNVRLVSISTDPDNDTPAVLQTYAQRFGASDRWLFLTGKKEEIYSLANLGFKLALVEDRTAKEPITHSTRLVLVDRVGTVRGFYDGIGEDGSQRLLEDLHRLEKEQGK
jgi:protein SCO1/2